MPTWIDYRHIRAHLQFSEVLRHYNIDAKIKGDRATAICPLPTHPLRTDGKKRTPSLSINLERNLFNCFGCKQAGNAFDFVRKMEGFNPDDPAQLRSAAAKVIELFHIPAANPSFARQPDMSIDNRSKNAALAEECVPNKEYSVSKDAVINPPLGFELKHLNPAHSYLGDRGFLPETVAHFGLGYCDKGLLKGRIAIPLHDAAGQLVGYAGRLTDDSQIREEQPKYRFPGPRTREGKQLVFSKSALLYNAHRIQAPIEQLIVVEGFASVWRLWQHGYADSVALMGSVLADLQLQAIHTLVCPGGRIVLLPDGDDAGDGLAANALPRLAESRWCHWMKIERGRQPTDLSSEELARFLT